MLYSSNNNCVSTKAALQMSHGRQINAAMKLGQPRAARQQMVEVNGHRRMQGAWAKDMCLQGFPKFAMLQSLKGQDRCHLSPNLIAVKLACSCSLQSEFAPVCCHVARSYKRCAVLISVHSIIKLQLHCLA